MEHADADTLAVLGVETPAGHAVQLEAPAEEAYVPIAQGEQPDTLAVPGLVTVPEYPGAHTEHAATEVRGPVV